VHEKGDIEGRSSIMAFEQYQIILVPRYCCFDNDAPRPQWEESEHLSLDSTPSFLRDRIGAKIRQGSGYLDLKSNQGRIYVNS
jgi:hypothetical protein